MATGIRTGRTRGLRAIRYAALRAMRPELFADGPDRLTDAPEAHEGVLAANPWHMMLADPVTRPDGRRATLHRVVHVTNGPPVAILPIDANGRIVMLDHWRHATRRRHLEIPRGFGENDVTGIDQAAAELREELGVEAETLTPIGTMHPDTGLQAVAVELFVARLARGAMPRHDEGHAQVVIMDEADFTARIADGTVTDPFAIVAWTRYALKTN